MKNKTFKKSLSVIMAVLMLMSCWVFFPGMVTFEAEAINGTVYGVPAVNGGHYNTGSTNAYGAPLFNGNTDRWFEFKKGDDWTRIYYPSHIYLDKTESLQAAGYYFNVQWHFGNNTDYRILLGANIWGDNAYWGGYSDRNKTMNNIFSNYAVDASLPQNYPNGGGLYGTTASSTNYDLRIVGYNHSGQGSDGFNENGIRHEKYVLFRSNQSTNNATIYLMGNPSSSYIGKTTEYNTSGGSFKSYGLAQKYNSGWGNHSDGTRQFRTKDGNENTSSYMEGQYEEMQWFVTIYDKEALNDAYERAKTIFNQNAENGTYIILADDGDDLSTFDKYYGYSGIDGSTPTLLKTRETYQNNIDTERTGLIDAVNNLKAKADNSELRNTVASAEAITKEVDYAVKYTQATRNALENAISAAKNSAYYNGVTTYQANFSEQSTWNFANQAKADQDAINALVASLNSAMSMEKQSYSVLFDNLFDYRKFNIGTGSLTVDERTNTGFTVTSTGDDANTGFSSVIPVESGKTYILSADVSVDCADGDTKGYDMYIHTLDANQAGETTATVDTSNGAHREGDVYISLTGQKTETEPYIRFTAGNNTKYIKIRFDANTPGNKLTVNNIRVYEEGKVADGVSYELSKTGKYGDAYGTLPVPTRDNYTFAGWVDGSGIFVTANTTYTGNTVLYSTWKSNTFTVTWEFADGSTTTQSVEYGKTPTAPANTAAKNDKDGHHTYYWPEIGAVTGDVTYKENINTVGHTYDRQVATDTYKATDATCEAQATYYYSCSCGEKGTDTFAYGELAAHTPGAAATCTAPQTCTVCGTELVAMLGHKEEIIPAVSATCTSAGLTEGKKCSVCGEITVAQTETPMAAHTEVEIPAKEATCTETGLTAGKKCSVCGTVTVAQNETPMAEHDMGEWSQTKAPTCITAGEDTRKCANCTHTETRAVAATGVHVYGEWTADDTKFTHSGKCIADSNCSEKTTQNHSFTEDIQPKAGSTSLHDYKCSVCDARGADIAGTPMEGVGEDCFSEFDVKPISGNNSYHKIICECGREKDSDHETEVVRVIKDPTCIEKGSQEEKCTICKYTFTRELPSLGHAYIAVVTAPTCTEQGYTTHTCSGCGDSYVDSYVDALGHEWSETYTSDGDGENGTHYQTCTRENCGVKKESVPHTWDGGKVTTAATCLTSGVKTYTCTAEACGATYTATIAPDGHTFGETVKANDATCLADGNEAYKQCTVCNLYFAENEGIASSAGKDSKDAFTLTKLSHSYTGAIKSDGNGKDATHSFMCVNGCNEYGGAVKHTWNNGEVTTSSTCITGGEKTYTCTADGCGATYTEDIDADGHKFGETVKANDATCLDDGNEAYKQCTVCNLYFAENEGIASSAGKDSKDAFTLTKLSHSYTGAIKSDGNGKDATHSFMCVNGCNEYGGAVKHTWNNGEVTTSSTCITGGEKTYTCTAEACGATYTEDIDADGHKFGETVKANDATCLDDGNEAYKQCTVCNLYFAENEGIASSAGKDSKDAFTLTKLSHSYTGAIKSDGNGKDATHSFMCVNGCNEYGGAVKHTWNDGEVTISSTCITGGEKTYTCTAEACGATYTEAIDATGHTFGETVTANDATCLDDGNEAYKQCTVCNLYFAENAAENSEDGTKDNTSFIIPALGHDYAADFTVDKKATCEADGSKSKHCSRCDSKTEVTVIEKRTHVLVNVDVQTPATCLTDGVMNQKCSNVETSEYEACTHTTTAVIPALGHKFGETVAANDATCLDDGNYAYKQCTVCNLYFAENAAENSEDGAKDNTSFIIPALGHDYAADFTVDKKATCEADGSKSKHCSRCDSKTEVTVIEKRTHVLVNVDVQTPATCLTDGVMNQKCSNVETSEYEACTHTTTAVIPALGHKFGETVKANDATCLDDGNEAYKQCTVCNLFFAENAEEYAEDGAKDNTSFIIEKLGHDYKSVVTAPTCTEQGYTTHTCSRCGDSYKDTYTDALDHNFDTETYVWADNGSSCTATRVCKRDKCGYSETATAEITSEVTVPATCIAMGTTTYTATFEETWAKTQNKSIVDVDIDSNNHKTQTNHEQTHATCTTVGYTAGVFCEDCDKWISGHTEIPAIGHKNKVYHKAIAATCISQGTIEYWHCPDCALNYSDEDCTVKVTDLKTEIDGNNHTKLVKTDKKAATCTENGNIDYWTCEGCDNIYSDAAAENKITAEETVVSAINHKWGDWEFDADGKHKRVCENDTNHTETEACADSDTDTDCNCDVCENLVAHSYGNATCDAPATCTVCGATTGGVLGHDWKDVIYDFAEDGSSCTATRVCKRDAGHVENATAKITSEITIPATCTEIGTTTYTATFEEAWAETKTKSIKNVSEDKDNHVGETYTKDEDIVAGTCKSEKTWNEVTYCSDCDAKLKTEAKTGEKDATNHVGETYTKDEDIVAGTCKSEKTWNEVTYCSDCDAKLNTVAKTGEKDLANHVGETYTKDEDIVAGTCKSEKTWNEVTYCSDCDAKLKTEAKTGEKDLANHTGEANVTKNDKAATCTEEGYTGDIYWSCCGALEAKGEVIPVDASKHTGEANVTKNYKAATCTEEGYTGDVHWSCCDALKTKGEATGIDKDAHTTDKTHIDGYVAPTCITPGATGDEKYDCCNAIKNASAVIPVDATKHTGEANVTKNYKAATCTEEGYTGDIHWSCCDALETKGEATVIDKDAHTTDKTHIDGYVAPTCTTPGATGDEKYDCCNAIKTASAVIPVDATKHTGEANVTKNDKAATCTEEGYTGDIYWSCCGALETKGEVIPVDASKHTGEANVTKNDKAATCTEEGYTGDIHWSCCGALEAKGEVIPVDASKHTGEANVTKNDKAATCTEEGYTGDIHWSCCDALETKGKVIDIDKNAHTTEDTHIEGYVAPTCTTPGATGDEKYDCCNAIKTASEVIPVDASKHTGEANVTKNDKAATCTEEGYTGDVHWSCCDALETKGEATGIDKDAHTTDKTHIDGYVAPTCTTPGATGDEKYDCCNAIKTASAVIPVDATKHTGAANVTKNYKAATCTEEGYTGDVHWSCCDALETKGEVIPKLAHTEGQPVVENNTAPSCIAAGTYDLVIYCKDCGTLLSKETVSTTAGQHLWSEEATPGKAATCVEDGYECYYCIYGCGWYKEVILPATGHSFVRDEGSVVAPTCMNEGYTGYYCVNDGCNATEDRDFVPALEHSFEKTVIAPTCDENGYTVYTCTVCSESLMEYYKVDANGEYVYDENYEKVPEYPAEGHKDADGDGNCDHCRVNIVGACKCLCHSTNWFMRIIYMIVRFIWKLFKINPTCACGAAHF